MRRSDVFVPQAEEGDEFGQHAVKAMRRIQEIGYQGWLEEEAANPSWADADWCRMVVARLNGQVPRFTEDDSITFRCRKCKDTGFVEGADLRRHGVTHRTSAWCEPCAWRLWAKAQWLKKQEQEGPRRGRKLRDGIGGD